MTEDTSRPHQPPIVIVQSPAGASSLCFQTDNARSLRLLLLFAVTMIIFVFVLLVYFPPSSVPIYVLMFQMVFFVVIVGGPCVHRTLLWVREKRKLAQREQPADSLNDVVRAALVTLGGLCQLSVLTGRPRSTSLTRFRQFVLAKGVSPDVMILDAKLQPILEILPIVEEFVEPERLLNAIPRRSNSFVVQLLFLGFVSWMTLQAARDGDIVLAVAGGTIVVLFGTQVLKSLGVHFAEGSKPALGMGVLVDRQGRRWRVDNSTVYIHPMRHGFSKSVMIELIGPDGYLLIQCMGENDAALATFWQRWMHPNPRPELG